MSHPVRTDFPGALHHVYTRGNNKQTVFRDDLDRLGFLATLVTCMEKHEWQLFGWCLMGNHFHLIVRTEEATLSRGMAWLLAAYARRFNLRYRRSGHVFKARYGSVLVETDGQLQTLLRYVLRNPVEAGLCARPQDWRWSSYSALLTGHSPRVPVRSEALLQTFCPDPALARIRAAEFINAPLETDGRKHRRLALDDVRGRCLHPDWMAVAHFDHDYSIAEIADFVGQHRSTVWRRINKSTASGGKNATAGV